MDVRGRLPFGRGTFRRLCFARAGLTPGSSERLEWIDVDEDGGAGACAEGSFERGCSGGGGVKIRRGVGKGGVRGGDTGWIPLGGEGTSWLSRDDDGRGSILGE